VLHRAFTATEHRITLTLLGLPHSIPAQQLLVHAAHPEEDSMWRERTLKVVLVFVGLFFCAGVYPLVLYLRQEPALSMMLSLYVTLGVFLLVAVRNPSAHRSLIAFTAWSSLAHAAVMEAQVYRKFVQHGEGWGMLILCVIGVALIAFRPAKQTVEQERAAIASKQAI
jgi:drug/metabolite transporter superfamily protein YnfA